MSWYQHDTVLYYLPKNSVQQPTLKLAGFDLDGTLLWSDHGETYATTSDRWVFPTEDTPNKLKQLKDDGYTLALFSNRKGTSWMHASTKKRIEVLFQRIGFDFPAFLSIRQDMNRKPNIGMYTLMCQLFGVKEVTTDSFYCGDAMGTVGSLPWYQWSDADLLFAKNIGLPIKEPRQILGEYPAPPLPVNVQLIITCGQYGSGWDLMVKSYGSQLIPNLQTPLKNEPTTGLTVPAGEYTFTPIGDRRLYIFDQTQLLAALTINLKDTANVVMICGSNPTLKDRQSVINSFKLSAQQCAIYWYTRPCYYSLPKTTLEIYIKNFQHPSLDTIAWYRAN